MVEMGESKNDQYARYTNPPPKVGGNTKVKSLPFRRLQNVDGRGPLLLGYLARLPRRLEGLETDGFPWNNRIPNRVGDPRASNNSIAIGTGRRGKVVE